MSAAGTKGGPTRSNDAPTHGAFSVTQYRAATGSASPSFVRRRPTHSTAFTSARAFVVAENAAWFEAAYVRAALTQRVLLDEIPLIEARASIEIPVRAALGPDWRRHVVGWTGQSRGRRRTEFPDTTVVYAAWRMDGSRRWYNHTCYPHPVPKCVFREDR